MDTLSVIIPAHNESSVIAKCLDSLLLQTIAYPFEVIVAANACKDATVDIARPYAQKFSDRGFGYQVLDIQTGGKTNAMNEGDLAATGAMRAYLDADIVCSKTLFEQIYGALDREEAVYASGKMVVAEAKSWVSRQYSRFWSRLPFMTRGVPGAGLYCVNRAGRARWTDFPDTFSDDTYVRLQFGPEERNCVAATYYWPVAEGFSDLVRVRGRQDYNTKRLIERYPELMKNEDVKSIKASDYAKLILSDPIGFAVYAFIKIINRAKNQVDEGFRSR